jgi:hypothetical protein
VRLSGARPLRGRSLPQRLSRSLRKVNSPNPRWTRGIRGIVTIRATDRLRIRPPHLWFLLLTVAGCLAAGLVASPASAAPDWSRPMNVSGVVSFGEETPLVGVDSAGNATAVWQRYRGGKLIYESAVRQAGGRWSTPSRFSGGLERAYELQIAVDDMGNQTAVWVRRVGRSWVVQSATRPAGGSWSAPLTLSPPRKAARSPQIALDPQGGATAVWEDVFGGSIESSTRSLEGIWSVPVTLSATGVRADWPQVAVDSQGNATAVWAGRSSNGRRTRIQGRRIETATLPAAGTWSAPVSISKAGRRLVQDPQIAVSPQGEATAIWQRSNGSSLAVQGATRPAGGVWSRPVDITTGHGRGGQKLQLGVDSWGNATAIWEGYDTRPGPNFAIQAAKHPPGGTWSRPTDISRWTNTLGEPKLAVDSQGRSTAIWAVGARGGVIIQSATSIRR